MSRKKKLPDNVVQSSDRYKIVKQRQIKEGRPSTPEEISVLVDLFAEAAIKSRKLEEPPRDEVRG